MKSGERTFGLPPYCFGDWREGLVCDPSVLSEEAAPQRHHRASGAPSVAGRSTRNWCRNIALAALFDRVIHERAACAMPFAQAAGACSVADRIARFGGGPQRQVVNTAIGL